MSMEAIVPAVAGVAVSLAGLFFARYTTKKFDNERLAEKEHGKSQENREWDFGKSVDLGSRVKFVKLGDSLPEGTVQVSRDFTVKTKL